LRLGYVRLRDWAVERLGLSARTLRDLARMDAALAELPGLERAFVAGELSWAKVRLLARVALPGDEARWLALARRLRVRALEREARAVDLGSLEAGALAEGAETDEDGAPVEEREGVAVVCAPAVRAKWFRARELGRRTAGEALPVWAAMEAVAAEVASAIAVEESGPEEEPARGGAEGIGAGEAPRPGVAWVRPEAAHLDLPVRPRAGSWRARMRAELLGVVGAANGCTPEPGSTASPAASGCAPQRASAPRPESPGGI
jgi:hypothetical protein